MVMEGAPPRPQDVVTPANWQRPPYHRWAFVHAREVLPTQRVRRSSTPRPLPAAASAPAPSGEPGDGDPLARLLGVAVERTDGRTATAGEVLSSTDTDGWMLLRDGRVLAGWTRPDVPADSPHILMSVTKTVVGCITGVLAEQGVLDVDDPVERHVPELADAGHGGCSVRHLLDMRSGVQFSEEYTDATSDIRVMERAIGWRPGGEPASDAAEGLYAYLRTLRRERPPGGPFAYSSADTDVLGWVCERASGARMAALVHDLLWEPMGAADDAELLCDGVGTAVHDGGLAASVADLARFGQLLLDGGAVGERQVVPRRWIASTWAHDADVRQAFAASGAEAFLPGGWYRNQAWLRPGPFGDQLLCLGIHGQLVRVDPRTRTVAVKVSSWPTAQDPVRLHDTLRTFDAMSAAASGVTPSARRGEGARAVMTGKGDAARLDGGSAAGRDQPD
jgi:hypothetical protein